MKRIKEYVKRYLALLLVVLVFSFTIVSDYQEAQASSVAVDSLFEALKYVTQMTLLRQGYSFSNSADLDTCTKGLENLIKNYKDSDSFSDAAELTLLYNACFGKKIGDTISIAKPAFGFVQNYLSKVISDKSSYTSFNVKADSTTWYTRCDINFKLLDTIFYNKDIHDSNAVTNEDFYKFYNLVNADCLFVSDTTNVASGLQTIILYYLVNGSSIKPIQTDNLIRTFSEGFLYKYGFARLCLTSNLSDSFFSTYSSTPVSGTNTIEVEDIDNAYVHGILYKSWADCVAVNGTVSLLDTLSPVYGSQDSAKDIEYDEDDSVSIKIQDSTDTDRIIAAINQARADDPSITDADIDKIVAKVIAGMNAVTDTDTDDPAVPSTPSVDYTGSLTDIFSSIQSLRETLVEFNDSYTEGSSALQQDADDIADQFKVIEGGGNNEDPDEDPKVWVPGLFITSSLLKPLMEFIGNPLSEITKFLNRIMDSLSGLPQLFDEKGKLFLGNIVSDMSTIASTVGGMARTITGLPQAIADAIEIPEITPAEIVEAFNNEMVWPDISVEVPTINVPEIDIPEIKVPEITLPEINIPNYFDILGQILAAIQSIFIIDTVAVADSADDLKDVWDDHFPFIPKLKTLIESVSFSDSYDYPSITMTTPQIIRDNGYNHDKIILIDFEKFATYMVWGRRIVRAMLWVGFIYSIIRQFKINFHIG